MSALNGQQAAGRLHLVDPSATATVLLASLTYYRLLEALIGRVPGEVGWVESAVATLHGTSGAAP